MVGGKQPKAMELARSSRGGAKFERWWSKQLTKHRVALSELCALLLVCSSGGEGAESSVQPAGVTQGATKLKSEWWWEANSQRQWSLRAVVEQVAHQTSCGIVRALCLAVGVQQWW